jgi:hypothetical protein
MSLDDVLARDIDAVFFRPGDGAKQHKWEDKTILVLTDRSEELKRKTSNVMDLSYENGGQEKLIHVPAHCFEKKPEAQTTVRFDDVSYTILDVGENDGVYDITLTRQKARKA